jgi:erythronate-4-phosphate dehydrogenase
MFVQMVLSVHDPKGDDGWMREIALLDEAARGPAFDRLRKEYPVRREWGSVRWEGAVLKNAHEPLKAVGFSL